jgi:hypothetical protein
VRAIAHVAGMSSASSGKYLCVVGVTDWITGLFWAVPLFGIPIAFVVRAHVSPRERKHSDPR